jgi:hypothetical protein
MLVETGQKGGPGWATPGGVVELRETQTVPGQRIEVGRPDFSSEATDIRITHIVGENDHHIGLGPKQDWPEQNWDPKKEVIHPLRKL